MNWNSFLPLAASLARDGRAHSIAFCQVLLCRAAIPTDFFLSLLPPPTWGPVSSLAWSPAKPLTGSLCPNRVFEKGTLYQNSHWFPTDLGIKSTLQFGLWPWWPVACLSLWPLLETLTPLSPCLGHTAFEKAPRKGTKESAYHNLDGFGTCQLGIIDPYTFISLSTESVLVDHIDICPSSMAKE